MGKPVSESENESMSDYATQEWNVTSMQCRGGGMVGTPRCKELSDSEGARVRVTEGEWEL